MSDQEKSISSAIKDLVRQKWGIDHAPYLLSNLGTDLKSKGFDYKSIINGIKLIDFIKSDLTSVVKIVQHPNQKTKIGLVPVGQDYDFSTEIAEKKPLIVPQHTSHQPRRPRNARHVVMNFLEALADLEPEDLDKVHIPVSVLARLVAGK